MALINFKQREINCKIVYYGPGLCGKTTNLQNIYERTKADKKGEIISLATKTDRTLYFDFLPLNLGTVRGMSARLHLYTVPGQVHYEATRRLVLKSVDGVVFVADSQIERMEANLESLADLQRNLKEYAIDLAEWPFVIQYNKRDLGGVLPVVELSRLLNPGRVPEFEASAVSGKGVFSTLKAITKLVLLKLKEE